MESGLMKKASSTRSWIDGWEERCLNRRWSDERSLH